MGVLFLLLLVAVVVQVVATDEDGPTVHVSSKDFSVADPIPVAVKVRNSGSG